MKTGLALFAGSALIALIDGGFQFGSSMTLMRREMMGFTLLGSWMACTPALALLALLLRRHAHPERPAFLVGIGIGLCPLLMAWLPMPWNFVVAGVVAAAGFLPFSALLLPPAAARGVVVLGSALFLALSPVLPSSATSLTPPIEIPADLPVPEGVDVFLISIDTLRGDAMVDDPQLDGLQSTPLPFLDRVREGAMWADYGLSNSNQTLPGHVGMFTGVDAMEHGMRSNIDFPDPSIPNLAEYFQAGGWHTAGVISNALVSSATGMHRGFNDFSSRPVELAVHSSLLQRSVGMRSWIGFVVGNPKSTARLFAGIFARDMFKSKAIPFGERVTSVAMEQLENCYASPRPFFHFIHMLDPHAAYAPPARYRGKLSSELAPKVPKRFLPTPDADLSSEIIREIELELQGDALVGDEADTTLTYYQQVYLEEMLMVNECLERIFERADASQRPYVVLFTSDHGEQFGEHDFMEHANSMFRKNLEVPFMLWGPGVEAKHLRVPPRLRDVAPTLLHLAGLPVPDAMNGRSLLLPEQEWVEHVATDQRQIAIYTGDGLKWVGDWPKDGEGDGYPVPVALFDLRSDPNEEHNLLLDDPDRDRELRPMIAEMAERDTFAERQDGSQRSEVQMAAFEELGYAGIEAAHGQE